MLWEILGFLLTAFLASVLILLKFTSEIYPKVLKKALSKLAISNWQKGLAQKLPVYNFPYPKTIQEAGLFSHRSEIETEKPKEIEKPGDSDNLLVYGIDENGNAVVAEISRLWNNFAKVSLCINVNGEKYSVSFEGECSNHNDFSLGNFKLEMVEPFRIWRFWYNGYLEKSNADAEGNLAHVTLNFLWKPLESPSDIQKNGNLGLLSEYISDSGLFGERFSELGEILPNGYFQFGILHGMVNINAGDSSESDAGTELYMHGYRLRQHLSFQSKKGGKNGNNRIEFFGMCGKTGNAFRLVGLNDDWIGGEISYASFNVQPIKEVDAPAKSCLRDNSMPKNFTISDSKKSQSIEIWPKLETISNPNNSLHVTLMKMEINGKSSRGIIIRKKESFDKLIIKPNTISKKSDRKSLEEVVDFYSDSCMQVDLVGGKGASLGSLAQFALTMKCCETNEDFKTAKGFCVTTNLFKKMVDLNKISEIFAKYQNSNLELEELCTLAVEVVINSEAETHLATLIEPWLSKTFGDNRSNSIRFAVRSSGVLEDGADLSCAGQNETFLGVYEKLIPAKIVQCWASLFTSQSVLYRLNHGQPAVSEIAVVIQEMVNASSAGVMFTADPRTGNPFEMLVTANYGLGESVVSGSCDPDSITLKRPTQKSLFEKGEGLVISKKTLGDKKSKVVLVIDGETTEELEINEDDAKSYCLDDATLLKLGRIGTQIENQLGHLKPVDIEWAVSEKGEIFILQCRAMTSLHSWTDFEILHEFDTALRTKIDRLTVANTAEVMPKPLYPISIHSTSRNIDIGIQIRQNKRTGEPVCPFMNRTCPIYGQRLFINVYHCLYKTVDEKLSPEMAAVDLSIFGREVIDEEVYAIVRERHGVTPGKTKLSALINAIKIIWQCTKIIDSANEKYSKFTLNYNEIPQTSEAYHEKITQDLWALHNIAEIHCGMSEASSTTLVFAFMIITEGKAAKDWTPTLYEDTATLLSVYSAVESAEMPLDIDNLGSTIVKLGKNHKDFLNSKSTNDATTWLRNDAGLKEAFEKFLDKHGHRSIAEMDLGQTSWGTDPTPLIGLLKNIVRNKLDAKSESSPNNKTKTKFANDDELLKSLKTPLKSGSKRFLKFLLPHCRKTVLYRENSKSLTVRIIVQFKQVYAKLGELMVKEHLLTNADLLRFLTHGEMGLLIRKSSSTPTILYKAMRRQKLHPSVEMIDYPEINDGIPQPIDNSKLIELCDVVKATPVSSGKVRGIAKVCLSVEEASELIQPGDILITRATDIAWSPFFPIVGGVVTELGGLISHGAVVAREYGLPCIVGAVNATKIFKTGDEVILDTSSGTLAKVKATI